VTDTSNTTTKPMTRAQRRAAAKAAKATAAGRMPGTINTDMLTGGTSEKGGTPPTKATQHADRKARTKAPTIKEEIARRTAPKNKAVTKTAPAKKPEEKKADPALIKVVLAHAEKNKGRNGWEKVLRWSPDTLKELLAGAKTENAAIKRTRAKIEAK
jgi:hypothetical protein